MIMSIVVLIMLAHPLIDHCVRVLLVISHDVVNLVVHELALKLNVSSLNVVVSVYNVQACQDNVLLWYPLDVPGPSLPVSVFLCKFVVYNFWNNLHTIRKRSVWKGQRLNTVVFSFVRPVVDPPFQ